MPPATGEVMNSVTFMAMIDDTSTALRVSGNGCGGKLTLAFDDSQLPQVLKATLLRRELLKITLALSDDTTPC